MATIEQQKALAMAQARRRRAEAETPSQPVIQPASPATTFLNRGIANTLGAPVDLVNAGLGLVGMDTPEPFAGSKSIESLFRSFNIAPRKGEQPVGFGPRVAQGVGEAAGALLPMGAIAKVASGGTGIAANIGRSALETAAKSPVATTAVELASGAGSGVGGAIAEQVAPGNRTAQTIAEIIGGMGVAGGVGAAGGAARLATRGVKKVALPFTKAGSTIRASDRLRSLVPDAEEAANKLGSESISNISPARKIGDERLIALEDAVRNESVSADQALRRSQSESLDTLQSEMQSLKGSGNVADTKSHLSGRQERLSKLLDDRVKLATDKVEEKVSKLTPKMRSSQSSIIAREELDKALGDARFQEKALWKKIPEDVLVEKNTTTAAYDKLMKETPRAQQGDIPKSLMNKFFAQPPQKKLNIVNARGEPLLGDTVPKTEKLTELQGLRSKLLEEGRKARSEGNFNKARIHDDLADAVLEDIGAVPGRVQGEIGQSIRDAIDFSRGLNEKFTRGEVGKVLGFAKEGGGKTAPELTLKKLIGGGNVRGDVSLNQMLEAADTPELRGSVEDYLRSSLNKTAIKDGKVNVSAAKKFMEQNADILDKFPNMRKDIEGLSASTDSFLKKAKMAEGIKKKLVSDSKNDVSKFINAPVDKEFDVILGSRDPAKFMKDLVNRAAKDETGSAAKGLKSSAVDYLLKKSVKDGAISGKALLNNVNQDQKVASALKEILTPAEMQKLRRIGGEMKAIQAKSDRDVAEIIGDRSILDTLVRMAGARVGRKISSGTIQEPGIVIGRARNWLNKLTNDKARELLIQAVQDEQLMKALLTSRATKEGKKMSGQRMQAWLLGPGSNLLDNEEKE